MKNLVFTDNNGKKYKQVSKVRARKLFTENKSFVICASNLNPFGFWQCGCHIENNGENEKSFDSLLNEFLFYNCTNNEVGYYARFYEPI